MTLQAFLASRARWSVIAPAASAAKHSPGGPTLAWFKIIFWPAASRCPRIPNLHDLAEPDLGAET